MPERQAESRQELEQAKTVTSEKFIKPSCRQRSIQTTNLASSDWSASRGGCGLQRVLPAVATQYAGSSATA
jgi:hypothetical protein